ncbi:MAG: hypothetical protein M5U15_04315 [Kiritimatiellae bacterium]|nr:hypothetical protein [Kiritimatiellia bacterium]
MEDSHPNINAALMEAVRNQLRDNNPPETRINYDRLLAQGISEEDAKNFIAQAISIEIWDIMKNKTEFKLKRFIRNVNNLPAEPKE